MVRRATLEEVARYGRACARSRSRASGRRRSGGRPAVLDPLTDIAEADRIALWRESYVDGGIGDAAPWQNVWNPGTRDLSTATQANRPLIDASDDNFGGHPSYTWDGTTDLLAVSGDLVSFKPLHDGTGVVAWGVIRPTLETGTHVIFTTATASATNVGCVLRYVGTTNALRLLVFRGASPSMIDVETAPDSAPIDTVTRWVYAFRDGASPEWELRINGAIVANGTPIGAPSTANHTSALTVGRDTTASSFFGGAMAELGICKAYTQRAQIATYLQTRYPA